MLFDFGKVKSGVNTEQAKLSLEQAKVLIKIDDISLDVAQTIINIQRYQKLIQIANQQISGIRRIQEMANLRANAGISSQADPVQAQSYLQSAQSALIAQQSLLAQYQQHLNTLLGFDVNNVQWAIPDDLVQQSDLYSAPQFNIIPQMIAAQAGIDVARSQKQQTQLSRYPTLSVKGELSQALHGRNPNNDKEEVSIVPLCWKQPVNFIKVAQHPHKLKRLALLKRLLKLKSMQSIYKYLTRFGRVGNKLKINKDKCKFS
jgi:adhesin transport system outer membrane protein